MSFRRSPRNLSCRPNRPSDKTVCLVALGCPKNLVDSEYLLGALAQNGYRPNPDPGSSDVVVVTTCAFLGSAVEESKRTIRRLLQLKRRNPNLKVVVAGCLVQRVGPAIRRAFPNADLFIGIDDFTRLPALLRACPESFEGSQPGPAQIQLPRRVLGARHPRLVSTPNHYAYLKIADGCDNHCSYCLIPGIRGRLRSRPIPDLVSEAAGLGRAGVKELVLVAQDTTAYGTDIYQRPALHRLLDKLGRLDTIRWLRLMYTHPAHVTPEVLTQLSTNPKLCRYIDLPVQHCSDRVLASMNRHYDRNWLEHLLAALRSIPELRIRTTVIVGYPGETEAEFEELLRFVRQTRFDRLGAYAYSREPDTRSAALKGQIPEKTKQERLKRLMQVQAAV